MQVLEDMVIINASPAQKEILRNPKYSDYFGGIILDLKKWNRPRIPVSKIRGIIKKLQELQTVISKDPAYENRHPVEIIDRIILNIEDAAAVQARTYPAKKRR